MNNTELQRYVDSVEGGCFDCLKSCCAELQVYLGFYRAASADQRDYMYEKLCVPACGPGGGKGPQNPLPPPVPPPLPSPAPPVTPTTAETACRQKLKDLLCKDDVQSRLSIIRSTITALLTIGLNNKTVEAALMAIGDFIDLTKKFCADPDNVHPTVATAAFCSGWQKAKEGWTTIQNNAVPGIQPLLGQLSTSFTTAFASELNACCGGVLGSAGQSLEGKLIRMGAASASSVATWYDNARFSVRL